MIKIELDNEKVQQLSSIAHEPIKNLKDALSHLRKSVDISSRKQLEEAIREHTSDYVASAITDMLVSFSSFVDGNDADLRSVFAALTETAEDSGLPEQELALLSERKVILKELCEVPRVSLIGKSFELRDTAGNKLLGAKIYTFSRPIFDRGRDSIEGAMILSSVRIDYLNKRSEQDSFEVTLSQRQLEQLASEIENGIKKVEAYNAFLKDAGLNWVLRYEK